jgi:hypothetical protein
MKRDPAKRRQALLESNLLRDSRCRDGRKVLEAEKKTEVERKRQTRVWHWGGTTTVTFHRAGNGKPDP